MSALPIHPPLPPTTNWMTLSPIDNIKAGGKMSTIIENSKTSTITSAISTTPVIPSKLSSVVTTIHEVQTPSTDDSLLDTANLEAPLPILPSTSIPASTRLQKMLKETDKLIVCPGVYDGLSTRIAHEVGFDALYMVRYCYLYSLAPSPRILTDDFSLDWCRYLMFPAGHG